MVASNLGYQRLGKNLRVKLQGDMMAAMRRGIIQSDMDMIIAGNQSIQDYSREDLIKFICSVMKKNRFYDQETLIQETLRHLGFQRNTKRAQSEMTAAIRSGIRKGIIIREKGEIYRA